jgi:oxygen-independent coproporphyrinogen-3 oxidase
VGKEKNREWENAYIRRLVEEIKEESVFYRKYTVDTIFIGGGTPSVLQPKQWERVMKSLYENFSIEKDAEISMEMNPGTVNEEKMYVYRKNGINRISIGLQSMNAEELNLLGRIHSRDDFLDCYHLAKTVGFENINIDLISSLPGQNKNAWKETLQEVVRLRPQHISSYCLIVEENTPFYDLYGEGKGEDMLPSEEEDREMYYETRMFLESLGYRQYEISNYALPGLECKHNLGYWSGKNYVGFGLGASSYVGNVRWKNTDFMKEYLEFSDIKREIVSLTIEQRMEEFMFLGLRKTEGVNLADFRKRFMTEPEAIYGDWLKKMKKEELLQGTEQISLTRKGMDLANYVMAGFLLSEE